MVFLAPMASLCLLATRVSLEALMVREVVVTGLDSMVVALMLMVIAVEATNTSVVPYPFKPMRTLFDLAWGGSLFDVHKLFFLFLSTYILFLFLVCFS